MEHPFRTNVTACDPKNISREVKEAVGDSLLNNVFRRISGYGEYGDVILGERPSDYFTSGFLIPLNPEDPDVESGSEDIETNPIKIGAMGMDIGTKAKEAGNVQASTSLSIYVRILPTSEDLAKDKNPVKFTLSNNIRRQIRNQVITICRREKPNYNTRTAQGRSEWNKRQLEIRREINKQFGIELEPQETKPEEGEEEEGEPGEPPGASIFEISPGDKRNAPDTLFDNARPIGKWVRLKVEPPNVQFDLSDSSEKIHEIAQKASKELTDSIRERIEQWLESEDPETGGRLWAYPKGRTFTPEEIRNWDSTLETIRRDILSQPLEKKLEKVALPIESLDIRWSIQTQRDWSDRNRKSLHIALENWSTLPDRYRMESDQSVFQVVVRSVLPKTIHQPMRLNRIRPSYRYNRYLQYPALGFNCGITAQEEDDVLRLETTWVPKYCLPKIDPQDHKIDTSFKKFSDPKSCRIQGEAIVSAMEDYISKINETVDPTLGLDSSQEEEIHKEQEAFQNDMKQWIEEVKMIKRGVDLLTESMKCSPGSVEAAPFEAFSYMNQTMEKITKGKYNSWHLFQISFILATLPSMASRVPAYEKYHSSRWDNATTLLYFATGGGKTEAFLGLLLFGLFLDRLRGKHRGVTAMIRYPLRLLTIQQAQRASQFLAEAEKIRVEKGIKGAPFTIGFWVGGNNTPNRTNDQELKDSVPFMETETRSEVELQRDPKYKLATEKWIKLAECPFCQSSSVGLRRFKNLEEQAGYVCENENCWWNKKHPGMPLPFYFVDDDIYALAPSVLLGTIDKLALIGQHFNTIRRVLGVFGAATWIDSKTGRLKDALKDKGSLESGPEESNAKGVFPAYRYGEQVFFDPFPSLIIQDEAHLLEESLGTFAGLFETALNETFKRLGEKMDHLVTKDSDGNFRMPKVVVASATVSDPEKQIGFLYQQRLIHFPYPGPDQYWSFYAAPKDKQGNFMDLQCADGEVESLAMRQRIYASMLTNGKPHTTATVNILSAFHLNITQLICDFGGNDSARQEKGRKALIASLSNDYRYDDYREAINQADISELITMVDMHRVALTYVTNKKGGDQVMSAEAQQVPEEHRSHGYDLGDSFEPALITGSVDVASIKQVMDKAQDRPSPGKPFEDLTKVLRSIVATSAVSHGVDVEELNTMFFAGMPSDIAEYIQASSRVGRSHVGISVLVPIPQRKRDRYIVEIHDIFHRFLERMVRPAAIDRWAENAIERVVPSFFQTYMCGIRPLTRFIELDEQNKHNLKRFIRVGEIASISKQQALDEISNFIYNAIGLYSDFSPPTGSIEYYEDLIAHWVRDLLDEIHNTSYESLDLREFFDLITKQGGGSISRPMLSLRDVDQPGKLTPRKSVRGLQEEHMKELMKFLLRGAGAISDTFQED